MAALANSGGGGCQCNLTHHHQYRFSTTTIDPLNDFRVFWVHPPGRLRLPRPFCEETRRRRGEEAEEETRRRRGEEAEEETRRRGGDEERKRRRRRRGDEETRRRGEEEEEEEEGGMAAFANLGGGGCQCNLTHHHQLIYEPILHHLDRPFKRFQGVLGAPAGNRAPLRARSPQRNNARNPHQPARSCFCFYGHVAFSGV